MFCRFMTSQSPLEHATMLHNCLMYVHGFFNWEQRIPCFSAPASILSINHLSTHTEHSVVQKKTMIWYISECSTHTTCVYVTVCLQNSVYTWSAWLLLIVAIGSNLFSCVAHIVGCCVLVVAWAGALLGLVIFLPTLPPVEWIVLTAVMKGIIGRESYTVLCTTDETTPSPPGS